MKDEKDKRTQKCVLFVIQVSTQSRHVCSKQTLTCSPKWKTEELGEGNRAAFRMNTGAGNRCGRRQEDNTKM